MAKGVSGDMNGQKLAIALIAAVLALLVACGGEIEQVSEPTATPQPETKSVPDPEPQAQALMLRLISPEINLMTGTGRISVSGLASPDATLSVNGRLALPDDRGRFSIDLELTKSENPAAIEVLATSITGEIESRVIPVIFSDGPGVFGTVTAVTASDLTVLTDSGPVTLTLDAATDVRIHGWESPSAFNIAIGTPAAVLTDGPLALSVFAIPNRPVHTRHFTGIVVGPNSGDSITIQDDTGRLVTATPADGLETVPVGQLITAVLEQDLSTGNLTVTGIDPATAAADRLSQALALNKSTGAADPAFETAKLRWRLDEHGVRNISMLVTTQSAQSNSDAIELADEFYSGRFSEYRIGPPSADVFGMVTAIDSTSGQLFIQPEFGPEVMVKVSDTTPVALLGERVRSGQLDLASRVIVRHAISDRSASHITVLAGNTLTDESSRRLALGADRGELQGMLLEVGPSAATVTVISSDTGVPTPLRSAGAVVLRNGTPFELGPDLEGANVFARFDPASYRLLELDAAAAINNGDTITGVVHSFIPKVAQGNLTIRTPDGQLKSFTHNFDTVIRRDGLRISINELKVGDLVRPNTRVRTSITPGEDVIATLSLKALEPGLIIGIIRGVMEDPDGEVRVTISNIWLDLISLEVRPGTSITTEGQLLNIGDLEVGQAVTLGSYDPVTLVASQLKLEPGNLGARASLGN